MINVNMFLSTGREVAVRTNNKNIVAMYDYFLKLCDTTEYALPIDEEDLIDHCKQNGKFRPIIDDLSLYKRGGLSCVN